MTPSGVLQIACYFLLLILITKPVGVFLYRVFNGERTFLHSILRPLETWIYSLCGVREDLEQRSTQYTGAILAFSFFSFVFVYLLQRLQGILPLNPMRFGSAGSPQNATGVTSDLAFNTAVSFMTNTNWQSYAGESTMSYLVQMAGLTVQNFASAAAGIAVAVAVIRGFARQKGNTIGNFWVEVTRCVIYVLLPVSVVSALLLVSQGVPQNFAPYTRASTLEGAPQTIAQGPIASQEAIKEFGTNGGGFLNANSAHPYENPTPLANFFQMLLIFAIPAGLTYTFGRMVGDTRQGWAIFAAMAVLFVAGVLITSNAEQSGNPLLGNLGVEQTASSAQPGGNMEGKEVRFGISASALFATITTAASCGAVNSLHDSFTPLGGLVLLFNMQTSEVIFGGAGAGIYSILLYAILAVFIAGLMVGRTPEYLGKKIEQKEVKMAMLALIATAASILLFAAASTVLGFQKGGYWNGSNGSATANLNNGGPHGLAEIIYAYTSAAANNGSAFAGLSANTPWYNLSLGLAMLIGRFLVIVPMLAVAGSLVGKSKIPISAGTLPTHGALFVALLVGSILILGALTFFPALSLTPIVEHFLMVEGRTF
ncbi:MAG TPA: potassium-transporting ATPase subunit KdpA [Bryobacteraceae bacterium]|nr:potassium-transporting ATPase subunit KdpA [Bryobacteraceae bacterium]